jgi:hypothetical protein
VAPALALWTAAALAAAVSIPAQPAFPSVLAPAARGARCPGGGRAIGDPVGKSYILQELQIVTRDRDRKLVGFVYSGADGRDYIDLSPSDTAAKTRLMNDGEKTPPGTMMLYCFSAPWGGARAR